MSGLMRKLCMSALLSLLFASCGYHLAGHGDAGLIPANTKQMVVVATGGDQAKLLPELKQALRQGLNLESVNREDVRKESFDDTIEVRVEQSSESFVSSSFDASGIANQYRLTLSGMVRVLQSGKEIWASEALSQTGDVFATGDAVAIEAQKERVAESLRQAWAQKIVGRLRSGF